MGDWPILIVAACACAMYGAPAIWSSFPILLIAALMAVASGELRPVGKVPPLMRMVATATVLSAGWMAMVLMIRLEKSDAIAFFGGLGALVLGFWLGRCSSASKSQVSRLWSSVAGEQCAVFGSSVSESRRYLQRRCPSGRAETYLQPDASPPLHRLAHAV